MWQALAMSSGPMGQPCWATQPRTATPWLSRSIWAVCRRGNAGAGVEAEASAGVGEEVEEDVAIQCPHDVGEQLVDDRLGVFGGQQAPGDVREQRETLAAGAQQGRFGRFAVCETAGRRGVRGSSLVSELPICCCKSRPDSKPLSG